MRLGREGRAGNCVTSHLEKDVSLLLYFSSIKKLFFIPFLLITLLLLFLFFFLTACSATTVLLPELTVDGAIQQVSGKSLILKAYKPEIGIALDWPEGAPNTIEMNIKNMNTSQTQVSLDSTIEQQLTNYEIEIISETELVLKITGGKGRQYVQISSIPAATDKDLCFAILGDSQGRNDILELIIEKINQTDAEFLVHLGDMVPSGNAEEFNDFISTMENLNIPYYTVPGNHDVRTNGLKYYQDLFAPAQYYFDYHNLRFIFLDNSSLGLDNEQFLWLEDTIAGTKNNSFVFKHVPLKDPRDLGHSFIDPLEAERFSELITSNEHKIGGLFSGHIHMFYQGLINDIPIVISGGGGAPLYASPDKGGYNHFALVRVGPDRDFQVEPIPIEALNTHLGISVYGRSGETTFTADELLEKATITREGGFQNIHGNYKGAGIYHGVPVSSLVEAVGGMEPGDSLSVISLDGYSQTYSYENIYPHDFGWHAYQGDMILALAYDDIAPPEWQDGYRIVFLPEDGLFDNEDCLKTSAPNQGCHIYESAGSRWVKMVTRLEVLFKP